VLAAIGKTNEQARSSIRFSFGRYNTSEDVDFALGILSGAAARWRAMSPNWKEAASHQLSAISAASGE
jgi:cysteine desulfurase